MIVYDAMFVLCSVDQAVCAQLVDQTGCSAGEAVDVVDGPVGEDIPICAGVCQMSADVRLGLSAIIVRKLALEINSLTNGRICLQLESFPQFALTNKNECHGTLRVHPEIEQLCGIQDNCSYAEIHIMPRSSINKGILSTKIENLRHNSEIIGEQGGFRIV